MVGALHDCPEFKKQCPAPPLTDFSKSATSSRIIFEDLPPSSWWTLLTDTAEAWATAIPALVDPVKDIIATSGWSDSAAPTVGPYPFTTLKTPFGTPALSNTSARSIAQYGEISLGFKTIVQPAARAADTLVVIWFIGQFHGVIIPMTPIGSLINV